MMKENVIPVTPDRDGPLTTSSAANHYKSWFNQRGRWSSVQQQLLAERLQQIFVGGTGVLVQLGYAGRTGVLVELGYGL